MASTIAPLREVDMTRFWLEASGPVPDWFKRPSGFANIFLPKPHTIVFREKKGIKQRREYEHGPNKIGPESVFDVPDSTREVLVPAGATVEVLRDKSWYIADCIITRVTGHRREAFPGQLTYTATGAIILRAYSG
jgi:hypothetical protein